MRMLPGKKKLEDNSKEKLRTTMTGIIRIIRISNSVAKYIIPRAIAAEDPLLTPERRFKS